MAVVVEAGRINNMTIFKDERIWRVLSNIWTVAFLLFLIFDFFSHDKYGFLVAPFSVIYVAILGLFVATKEFDRWYEMHAGRHPGENFVVIWTVIVFLLLGISMITGGEYKLSSEAVASYIMILSIFALTQKSKALYRHKKELEKKGKK